MAPILLRDTDFPKVDKWRRLSKLKASQTLCPLESLGMPSR